MVTSFSTSSSNAKLPVSLRVAEQKLRLPPQISRFVLTFALDSNCSMSALRLVRLRFSLVQQIQRLLVAASLQVMPQHRMSVGTKLSVKIRDALQSTAHLVAFLRNGLHEVRERDLQLILDLVHQCLTPST